MTQSHQPRSARGPPLHPAYLVTLHPTAYPHPPLLHSKKEKVLAFSSFSSSATRISKLRIIYILLNFLLTRTVTPDNGLEEAEQRSPCPMSAKWRKYAGKLELIRPLGRVAFVAVSNLYALQQKTHGLALHLRPLGRLVGCLLPAY